MAISIIPQVPGIVYGPSCPSGFSWNAFYQQCAQDSEFDSGLLWGAGIGVGIIAVLGLLWARS
jgi:hypothetical protein